MAFSLASRCHGILSSILFALCFSLTIHHSLPSTHAYQQIQLVAPNYTNVIYQQSYDVPVAFEEIVPEVHSCDWVGTAFGYGNDTTGAFLSDGSCAIMLFNLPPTKDVSIQLQIAIDSIPPQQSVLFSLGNSRDDTSIEIGIAGTGSIPRTANNSDAFREGGLQVRVNNRGKSCANLGAGCPLDLPGFFQVGVFVDLLISFSQSGFTSVYLNGSFVKSDYLFKRNAGSSLDQAFIGASMATGRKLHGLEVKKPINLPDNAAFRIRSFTILNTTYSPSNITDFYSSNIGIMPSLTTPVQYSIKPDGSITELIPKEAKFNFYASPAKQRIDFSSPSIFEADPLTNRAKAVAVGSVQPFVRGALGSTTFDGAVLNNAVSYLTIPPLLITSESSFQVIFKMVPYNQSRVIFGCADVANGQPLHGIYLIASPLFRNVNQYAYAYNITLSYQRGRRAWFHFSAVTDSTGLSVAAQTMNDGILNILVTIDNSQVQIFNHGVLIGEHLNPPTFYPGWRQACTLGGFGKYVPSRYANMSLVNSSPTSESAIGYRFFGYWPSVLTPDSIGNVQVRNSSLSIGSSWDNIIFDFATKADPLDSSYIGRGAAEWSGAMNSFSVFQNGTNRLRSGWLLKNSGYLNLGEVSFGGDLSLFSEFSLSELKQGSTLFHFTNGPVYPGADEFLISIGAVDAISADLLINVKNSGVENPNGVIRLPGVLRAFVTHTLIIVFRANKINVYLDGVPLLLNGLLWSPAMVWRPYAFVGRSLEVANTTLPLILFSLQINNRVWTTSDVASLLPYNTTTYKFSFLSALQRNVEGEVVYFPSLHECSFSPNPFNLPSSQYDGTLQTQTFNSPTPGVYFDNKSPEQVSADYKAYLKRWNSYESLSTDIANVTQEKTHWEIVADRLDRRLSEIISVIESFNSTNSTNNTALRNATEVKNQITAEKNVASDTVNRLNQQLFYLQKQRERYSADETSTQPKSLDEFAGVRQRSYIETGPTLIGGPCTIRTKIRVKSVIDESKWMPVWELSNGPSNDTFALFISGKTSNQILQLVVYRGGRAKSAQSAPMDGSVYWLDIIITISDTTVKFYNWGNFVSSANGIWTPSRIIRSQGLIGRSLSSSTFLADSAISLVTFSNQLIDPVSIRALYISDHPAKGTETIAQMWQVSTPVSSHQAIRHAWLLDVQTKSNLFNDFYDFTCSHEHSIQDWPEAYLIERWRPESCHEWTRQVFIFQTRAILQDITSPRRNYLTPWFKTRKGDLRDYNYLIDTALPRSATSRSNLFDDRKIAQGSVIGAVEYFEPLVFFLPMEAESGIRSHHGRMIDWSSMNSDSGRSEQTWLNLLSTMGTQFKLENSARSETVTIALGKIGLASLSQLEFSSVEELIAAQTLGILQPTRYGWNRFTLETMLSGSDWEGSVDYCYQIGLCAARDDPKRASQRGKDCSCNQDRYNIVIIPPSFRFLYSGTNTSHDLQRERYSQPIPYSPDKILENRFYLASVDRKNAMIQPKSVSLALGESIIRVNTICNLRFELITNKGRSIMIGGHPIIDKITECPASSYYSEFSGSEAPAGDNVEVSADQAAEQFGADYDKTMKKKSKVAQTWGKPGYALHHMEGSLGAMYAYRFHWARTPVSYHITNVQFDISASDLVLNDAQPEYSVSVDLYNNSPIQQSITAIHSITKTKESSFSNTDTDEHHWEQGVSFNVEISGSVTAGVEGIASVTGGFSMSSGTTSSFGQSQSISTTYGNSVSTSEELQQWFAAEVPPKSKVTATLIAFQTKRTIPYKADAEIEYASGEKEQLSIHGIYKEVATDSIIVKYSDATSLDE